MRARLLVGAFLGSTALTAAPARAEPVSAFVYGFATYLSTGVAVGAGVGGAFAAGAATAQFLTGGFIGQIVLSIGLAAVSQMLMPSPALPSPSERLVNYAQAVSYQERVYGRVRKGGPLCFTGFTKAPTPTPTGDNTRPKRHYGVLIAAHSTKGPVTHWLDETEVETNGQGLVITAPMKADDDHPSEWHGSIRPYTGKPGQVADAIWRSCFPEITASHDFAGLSYAALYAARSDDSYFAELYPQGREWTYAPVWDGCDTIYDPRAGARGFTRNLALCLAHELVEYWGREVDWDAVAVEADACDQVVTNGDGGTQPRWRLDGTISDDMEFDAIRAQMIAAGDVFLFERPDGKVGFHVGRWTEPSVILTEKDFLALQISEGQDMGAANEFVVRYPEPANKWREAPSGVWVADPEGSRNRREIAGYMVGSHNQAVRIAKRMARTEGARYRLTGTLKASGLKLVGQRFARFDHAELGMSFAIEIGKLTWGADRITFGLEAVSTAAEDFAFVAATEEPARPVYESVVSEDDVEPPASLSGQAVQSTGGSAAIEWEWPEQDRTLRQQLRIREGATDRWRVIEIEPGQDGWITAGLRDRASYDAQLRNLTGLRRGSAWIPAVPITVLAVADLVAPGGLAAFDATGGASQAVIGIDAPNDAQYYATRIYRAAGGAPFAEAVLVRTEYGLPATSDSWTDQPLAPGVYRYWAEPINASGVAGARSGPATVTVT